MFFFRHNTLQRSVRFEEVVLTSTTAASVCPSSVSPASVSNRKLVASASVEAASETDGLLDATMPLPQVSITLPQRAEVILNKISNNINKTYSGLISVLQEFQKCIA